MPLKSPDQIAFLTENKIVFTDMKLPYVTCIDLNGSLLSKFYASQADHPVLGFNVSDTLMYIVQTSAITQVNLDWTSNNNIKVFDPFIDKMSKVLVLSEDKMIITSSTTGTVHEFNPKTEHLIRCVADLKGPSSICIHRRQPGTVQYVVF